MTALPWYSLPVRPAATQTAPWLFQQLLRRTLRDISRCVIHLHVPLPLWVNLPLCVVTLPYAHSSSLHFRIKYHSMKLTSHNAEVRNSSYFTSWFAFVACLSLPTQLLICNILHSTRIPLSCLETNLSCDLRTKGVQTAPRAAISWTIWMLHKQTATKSVVCEVQGSIATAPTLLVLPAVVCNCNKIRTSQLNGQLCWGSSGTRGFRSLPG